jgi:hypothetical protein
MKHAGHCHVSLINVVPNATPVRGRARLTPAKLGVIEVGTPVVVAGTVVRIVTLNILTLIPVIWLDLDPHGFQVRRLIDRIQQICIRTQ